MANEFDVVLQGGCLCGGVRYRVSGPVSAPVACHCSQCARTSGHHAVMASCIDADLVIDDGGTLRWYASSSHVRRGFCAHCGGNLFWKDAGSDAIYVTAGTLDRPTGLALSGHIFVESKSDYYELTDGLPQSDVW